MQGNVLGQSGSNAGLNIFIQPLEPSKKDGIWIKTDEKYKYDKVEMVSNIEDRYTKLDDIPYKFYHGSAVTIGTDIYLLGGRGQDSSSYYRNNYKYDMLINEYTQLAKIPYNFFDSSAVVIGTDIYLLGSGFSGDGNKNYKYDTITNEYTQLANIPYEFYNGSAVAVGTDIYLLGGSYNSKRYNYKYDILTNKYTKLEDIPYELNGASTVAIGIDIYLLGGSGDFGFYNYKYKSYIEDRIICIIIQENKLNTFLDDILKIYFSDVIVCDNYSSKDYPVYYGNGTQWIEI